MIAFTQEPITPAIRRIRGAGDVCMYLVEGSRRAALIDTGYGLGDLKAYVERMTDKPYDVLITHGHVDHAGGAGQFDHVYMNSADLKVCEEHCRTENRRTILKSSYPDLMKSLPEEEMISYRSDVFQQLEHGQIFDLGGISVETIHVPGHTQGIMAILIKEEHAVMLGDACGVGVLLFLPESLSVAEYYKSLLRLQKYEPQYDRVLREHGTCESTCRVLEDCLEACERVMNGTDDAFPAVFKGKTFQKAFACDPKSGMRLDGREGNIVYSKDKVF